MTALKVRYWYEILDWDNNTIDDLKGVVTGSHTQSAQATIHTSATITVRDTGQINDWTRIKIQAWIDVNGDSWPLGVYLPTIPEWSYDSSGRVANVILTDKLSLLSTAYHRPQGWIRLAPVTLGITNAIKVEYGEPVTTTESSLYYPFGYAWERGESHLANFNAMLRGINYFSLWVDGYGAFQVHPYKEPARRGVAARFVEGIDGVRLAGHNVYSPSFTVTSNFDTPNVYAAISQGDSENEGIYFEHRNMSLNDPTSVPNRGRLIWPEGGVEKNVDVPIGELPAYVRRRFLEVSRPSMTLEFTHPPMRLNFNDIVQFQSREHGIDGLFTVERIDANHTFDSPWRTRLRKVNAE